MEYSTFYAQYQEIEEKSKHFHKIYYQSLLKNFTSDICLSDFDCNQNYDGIDFEEKYIFIRSSESCRGTCYEDTYRILPKHLEFTNSEIEKLAQDTIAKVLKNKEQLRINEQNKCEEIERKQFAKLKEKYGSE